MAARWMSYWAPSSRSRIVHEAAQRREGGDQMKASDIQKELQESLLTFVKRASEKNATAAEVEALPAVAQVLKEMVT